MRNRNPQRTLAVATTRGRPATRAATRGATAGRTGRGRPQAMSHGGDSDHWDETDDPDHVVDPKPDKPNEEHKKRRQAAIKYVREKQKAAGNDITRKAAAKRVTKNTRADKRGATYAYDFAGDGAGVEDKQLGTKKNNTIRKKQRYAKKNVKGATAMGTGKPFKKATT